MAKLKLVLLVLFFVGCGGSVVRPTPKLIDKTPEIPIVIGVGGVALVRENAVILTEFYDQVPVEEIEIFDFYHDPTTSKITAASGVARISLADVPERLRKLQERPLWVMRDTKSVSACAIDGWGIMFHGKLPAAQEDSEELDRYAAENTETRYLVAVLNRDDCDILEGVATLDRPTPGTDSETVFENVMKSGKFKQSGDLDVWSLSSDSAWVTEFEDIVCRNQKTRLKTTIYFALKTGSGWMFNPIHKVATEEFMIAVLRLNGIAYAATISGIISEREQRYYLQPLNQIMEPCQSGLTP